MASLNDFKLVNTKSIKNFDILLNYLDENNYLNEYKKTKLHSLSETEKARLGFYLFTLEYITGISDTPKLIDIITDTNFNQIVFDEKYDDFGIDAIFINEEDTPRKSINLFNFKFRENYNPTKQQSTNDILISQKFTNLLISSLESSSPTINLEEGKIKYFSQQIIDHLKSNEQWDLKLFIVSNDSISIDTNDSHIKNLKDAFDLSIKTISLDDLKELLFSRPEPKQCCFSVDSEAVMSFTESPLDSSKSYIVRMRLSELIRITGDNDELCNEYNIEKIEKIRSVGLDFSVLYENVRGFILKSKYNNNIQETLEKNEDKFFLYNNGITITTNSLSAEPYNSKQKLKLTLNGFQVINGGQTLRSIHIFNQKGKNDEHIEKLNNAQILVRIFQTKNDSNAENKIAEYTNSQNAISSADLKSLRDEQIQIEKILDEYDIIYARKTGDLGAEGKPYKYKIGMERLGQILLALSGLPEKSSDQKRKIFDELYEKLFGETLDISLVPKFVNRYFEIYSKYKNSSYEFSDQKVFYITWLDHISSQKVDLEEIINYFENFLDNYKGPSIVAKSRYMIQVGFRQNLEENFRQAHLSKP
ncbi:AIPR family protein [Neisseria weaveri]|uniref:AIPR family protein n=1 Tax=Neisseria weaveri TaxID=28091 RepID=UPI0007C9BF67|nr:AIPR family protein [Neisseria weaveri]SAY50852.1 abortive infection phage resistance protein [Neisseria weaveri]